VWKQNRLAFTLNSSADNLIDTGRDQAALANLDESRRIIERLGLSDRGNIGVYARTLELIGTVNRDMKNEKTACEQFSKARDFYLKLGLFAASSPIMVAVEKDLATCKTAP
jgi:hypothetical protein